MKEKNPIDELFKQGLENKEIKPSDAVWSKIEETLEPEESRRGGFYFMRAAVVTLLVGLSSWVFLQNGGETKDDYKSGFENPIEINHSPDKDEKQPGQKSNTTSKKEDPKTTKKENKGSNTKKNKKGSNNGKARVKPIMNGTGVSRNQYVHHELPIADESNLLSDEPLISAEDLNVKETVKSKKFKIRYRVPVTEKSFYADSGENKEEEKADKPKFKERVFAYASDQFDNLMSGEPLELPKTDTKVNPQLEISLGKIFSNN